MPHVQVVTRLATDQGGEPVAPAVLLLDAAVYLVARGELPLGRSFAETSLAIRERALGPSHPDTADSLGLLGGILMEEGGWTRPGRSTSAPWPFESGRWGLITPTLPRASATWAG